MKKLVAVTGIVLIFMLLLNTEIIPALAQKKSNKNSDTLHTSSQIQLTNLPSYIIKEYNGKIAVFEKGSESPYRTTDMYVNFLPENDKNLLSVGIEVKSQAEVNKLLQDFIS